MVFRKIIAVLCSIAISFSLFSAPVSAITVEQGALCLSALQFAYEMYHDWKTDHPDAPDSEYTGFNPGGMFGGGVSRDEAAAAYNDYVDTLPATGYNSGGSLIWRPTNGDLLLEKSYYMNTDYYFSSFPIKESVTGREFGLSPSGSGLHCVHSKGTGNSSISFTFYLIVPASGIYKRLVSNAVRHYSVTSESGPITEFREYPASSFSHFGAGAELEYNCYKTIGGMSYKYSSYAEVDVYLPIFEFTPDIAPSADTYNTTTRPTSISGGNYGVVGDNNEVTKVEDNSTIVNETNNTYYNPATGLTVPITDWSYDYSDRSYDVSLESGDKATITYGDENISITETSTASGDTVTNNYTIYYLVDAPETPVDPPVDPPAVCTHDWTETSTTPATCTVPGSRLLTCSLCSQTKTESVPALGHDWEVKQTVNTQYDETGQLTQQGYTVFECGTCHEQYKSEDGALPPAVTPGTGEDLAAVDALKDKLKIAADALLGIFDKLPELFTGFTDFLAAVFPFVPTEFITIFELGLFLLIAAAALRKFLS